MTRSMSRRLSSSFTEETFFVIASRTGVLASRPRPRTRRARARSVTIPISFIESRLSTTGRLPQSLSCIIRAASWELVWGVQTAGLSVIRSRALVGGIGRLLPEELVWGSDRDVGRADVGVGFHLRRRVLGPGDLLADDV